jgi:pimeloyl-ACP methyl ester carboxylesterase
MGTTSSRSAEFSAAGAKRPTFVLVHSPLVGPCIWRWVGAELERWHFQVVIPDMAGPARDGPPYWEAPVQAAVLACREASEPLILVGQGEAGPLLPALALALLGRVRRIVFIDASLPPVAGFAEPAPSWVRDRLAVASAGEPMLRCSALWDEEEVRRLVPSRERRSMLYQQLPELPPDYFDHVVPVPEHWAQHLSCTYLWFSNGHLADAREAQHRGWPVRRLAGSPLSMVSHPRRLARELTWAAVGTAY